jgi:hypothetical protein
MIIYSVINIGIGFCFGLLTQYIIMQFLIKNHIRKYLLEVKK